MRAFLAVVNLILIALLYLALTRHPFLFCKPVLTEDGPAMLCIPFKPE